MHGLWLLDETPFVVRQDETAMSDTITFDEFCRIKLRVGEIVAAENHPNADKLLLLRVNLGEEERQLVAGIKGHYEPDELVGKKIIVVANLEPATIRGVESQGMLLAAGDGEVLSLLTVDRDVPAGASIT